jgi:mRNA interferase RelE/StbE
MRYEIRFKASALRVFERLERRSRGRLAEAIWALADNPRPRGCRKLAGQEGFYRIRVGDYRVIYEIQDRALVVLVLKLGHRRDVYRGL